MATAHASIVTASVTIQTMTVNDKQMTLAVFRQLPTRDLPLRQQLEWCEDCRSYWPTFEYPGEDDDCQLWGRVNYHTSDCPKSDHLHVVWYHGNDDLLLHATVRSPESYRIQQRILWSGCGKHISAHVEAGADSYARVYPRLASLPQLFIAV